MISCTETALFLGLQGAMIRIYGSGVNETVLRTSGAYISTTIFAHWTMYAVDKVSYGDTHSLCHKESGRGENSKNSLELNSTLVLGLHQDKLCHLDMSLICAICFFHRFPF